MPRYLLPHSETYYYKRLMGFAILKLFFYFNTPPPSGVAEKNTAQYKSTKDIHTNKRSEVDSANASGTQAPTLGVADRETVSKRTVSSRT